MTSVDQKFSDFFPSAETIKITLQHTFNSCDGQDSLLRFLMTFDNSTTLGEFF